VIVKLRAAGKRTFGHEKEMVGDDGELVQLDAFELI